MINLKMSDIINGTEALQKLSNTQLKAKLAWSVSRILKMAEVELQQFNDTRMQLIIKYGQKDENGELITDEKGNCSIEKEHLVEFNSELNELLATEITINANKLNIEDLENINFTPSEITSIEAFIDFGE